MNLIKQNFGGEQKRMELRFHPKNPFNKPLCGDNCPRAGLLLAVTVRRPKCDTKQPPQYQVRIVGHCKSVVKFESCYFVTLLFAILTNSTSFIFLGLCDFQYLPLRKDADKNAMVCCLDEVVPSSPTDIEYFRHVCSFFYFLHYLRVSLTLLQSLFIKSSMTLWIFKAYFVLG